MVDWGDVALGASVAVPTTVTTELILHRLRHRHDRRIEQDDAVRLLEDALTYVEDAWQPTGGRASDHRIEERHKRLAEFRAMLNEVGGALERDLQRRMARCFDAMATSAKAARARDVLAACRDGLASLDRARAR